MTILAGLGPRIVAELILIAAVDPLQVSQLFQIVADGFLIHDREINRVATAAHARGLYECVMFRLDTHGTVHWIGDNDVVFKRP